MAGTNPCRRKEKHRTVTEQEFVTQGVSNESHPNLVHCLLQERDSFWDVFFNSLPLQNSEIQGVNVNHCGKERDPTQ